MSEFEVRRPLVRGELLAIEGNGAPWPTVSKGAPYRPGARLQEVSIILGRIGLRDIQAGQSIASALLLRKDLRVGEP